MFVYTEAPPRLEGEMASVPEDSVPLGSGPGAKRFGVNGNSHNRSRIERVERRI